MNKYMFLILLALTSCSMLDQFKTKEKASFEELRPTVSNRELWLNRESDDLLLHPIFASLPLERRKTNQGIEVFSFQNSGGTTQNQSCNLSSYYESYSNSNLGRMNCETSRVEIKCSHLFYVSNNKVIDYKRVGQCYGDRFDFRPIDSKGMPVMTSEERVYWNKLEEFEKKNKTSCNVSEDCFKGSFCENGTCKESGILGKFIDL